MKPEAYERSLRAGLVVEKWAAEERLDAFSFNFLSIGRALGLDTVPFLAASKLLARGVGYGGEGDLLTAGLVAALARAYPETSFTEMFCPDWEHGTVYLSHMGELNWRLVDGKPLLLEMDYRWSDAGNPVYLAGRFKPGEILLVNLAPMAARLPPDPGPGPDAGGAGRGPHGAFRARLVPASPAAG